MSSLSKYVTVRGGYVDEDDCYYDGAVEFVQCCMLGFCGCGDPVSNLKYVLSMLELVARRGRGAETAADWFFYYWLDANGYTEHGSSLPGWLTPSGRDLIGVLREALGVATEGVE